MQYNIAQGRFSTTDIKKNANLRRVYFIFLFFFCQIEIKFKNKKEHTAVHNETLNDYYSHNVFVIFKINNINNNDTYIFIHINIYNHVIGSIFFSFYVPIVYIIISRKWMFIIFYMLHAQQYNENIAYLKRSATTDDIYSK